MLRNGLKKYAKEHGTPLLIIDHKKIRDNYRTFKKHLPRVQAYYAIKANSEPEIIQTIFNMGGSFDVASLQEFKLVLGNIDKSQIKDLNYWIYDRIIMANTIKPVETLEKMVPYRTLMTYDNVEELKKIKRHCPNAGLILRLRVSNTGSMVELSSKFGCEPSEAVDLIEKAASMGLVVEGLSFHVGSQCTNWNNYLNALETSAEIFKEGRSRGINTIEILNIGGGFPANYDGQVEPFSKLASLLRREINRLFPKNIEIVAEPGRFMVANAARLITKIIGKSVRDGKTTYHIDDGVYNTLSGVVFDHCTYHFKSFKKGPTSVCAVVGPTCDAFDSVSSSEELPDLNLHDYLYVNDIGAYSNASATNFNGFNKAKILHINQ